SRPHADQMLRGEAQAQQRRAGNAAQLYLRDAHHACRHFWSIRPAREERTGLALFRDRRQSFTRRHRARSADRLVAEDRWLNNRIENGEGSGVVAPNPSFRWISRPVSRVLEGTVCSRRRYATAIPLG